MISQCLCTTFKILYDSYEQNVRSSHESANIQIIIDNKGRENDHRLEKAIQEREEEIKELVRLSKISTIKKQLTESLDMKVNISISGDRNTVEFSTN